MSSDEEQMRDQLFISNDIAELEKDNGLRAERPSHTSQTLNRSTQQLRRWKSYTAVH